MELTEHEMDFDGLGMESDEQGTESDEQGTYSDEKGMEVDETSRLREKCIRFRALIIGRANAGKTTILKAICDSTDEPRIYRPGRWRGREEINTDIVSPSMERGNHDINDELVFSSNEGFVFHDSRGFESGSTAEVESMKQFISERASARSLDEKLHAIWYCIPTDNSRLLVTAELDFFDNCDPKGVPVIVIFTKFDSRDAVAFNKLEDEGLSFEEAEAKASQCAEDDFKRDELPRILSQKYPPVKVVYLRDMDKHNDSKTQDIIEYTTEALGSDTLKMLLVSVQKTNLNMCIAYALKG
ncbi:hypothetical protein BD410DRAFT_586477 [Rickenella mellea]|uniref:G domain-containing protein n=1 Tax=Rickenella mellea TaxID=50990 RepID=A0A4Y7PQW0_9AGAM|nr:hypothetical protein BD410DRAFT_586477 [Rickenella mellea]